jgi:hypothetical protein
MPTRNISDMVIFRVEKQWNQASGRLGMPDLCLIFRNGSRIPPRAFPARRGRDPKPQRQPACNGGFGGAASCFQPIRN